jgi:hypothetical protein
MAWKIGTQTYTTVDGELHEAEPIDTELTRSGADGTAFQVDAWRAATQTLTATVELSTAQAAPWRIAAKAMEGSTKTVLDQHGANWTCYVRRVRVSWAQNVRGNYLLRVTFTLVPASIRP